ncbi:MAG TPA: phospholipase D-like domain-containing protein [Candidatus Limnocylindria bacterium]|nr:phospholipase D-like domain-containing protein [Candidatus Limnocylindria bacterium]
MAKLLDVGDVDLGSIAEVRSALGIGTLEAAALCRAFSRASGRLGDEVARGVLIGVTAGVSTGRAPQLVWTAPGAPAAARRTAQVASEMLKEATKTAIVVGYSLTKAAGPFIAELAAATRRGVTCTLVADRMEDKLATLVKYWPPDVGLPPLWSRPADPDDEQSALHAKFIVVDSRRLLVTSANLTYHGFHGNIELGVLLDGSVAAQAEVLVREWSKAGLIHRVGAPA